MLTGLIFMCIRIQHMHAHTYIRKGVCVWGNTLQGFNAGNHRYYELAEYNSHVIHRRQHFTIFHLLLSF